MRLAFISVALVLLAGCPRSSPNPPHRVGAIGGIGGVGSNASWSMSQSATLGPAPTGTAAGPSSAGGMALDGIMGFRVSVVAPAGCVLAGAGKLLSWVYSPTTGLWNRSDPSLDYSVPSSALTACAGIDAGALNCSYCSFCSQMSSVDLEPGDPGGRVFYQASGVTLNHIEDGGTACNGSAAATGSCDAGCNVTVAIDGRSN